MGRNDLSGAARTELRARGAAARRSEGQFSADVLILVETIRRVMEEERTVTVGEIAQVTGQPRVFVEYAMQGHLQGELPT